MIEQAECALNLLILLESFRRPRALNLQFCTQSKSYLRVKTQHAHELASRSTGYAPPPPKTLRRAILHYEAAHLDTVRSIATVKAHSDMDDACHESLKKTPGGIP